MKRCLTCNEDLPLACFTPVRGGRHGRASHCRPCINARARRLRAEGRLKRKGNPEYHKRYYVENKRKWLESDLKRKYGLTIAEYELLLEESGGRCVVCGAVQGDSRKNRLSVDHCHRTGRVRGILCGRCNLVLGRVNDDPALLLRLAQYLVVAADA